MVERLGQALHRRRLVRLELEGGAAGVERDLTAQQRLGGMIVGLLPIWVLAFFSVTNPDFISPLWHETVGRVLLGAGLAMEITAFIVMRRIMSIEV